MGRRCKSRPARARAWSAAGTGKTSLFRAITGELALEHGSIVLPKRARIGRLAQEAPDGPQSLLDIVLAADRERSELLSAAEQGHDPHGIGGIHAPLADMDAHPAPSRTAA